MLSLACTADSTGLTLAPFTHFSDSFDPTHFTMALIAYHKGEL